MAITYLIDCPNCADGTRVQYDNGVYSCTKGLHTFTALPGPVEAAPTAEPLPIVPDLDNPADLFIQDIGVPLANPAGPVVPDPVAEIAESGPVVEPPAIVPAASDFFNGALSVVGFVGGPPPSETIELGDVRPVLHEGESIQLAGGDRLICVRVPELTCQTVAAEAEIQHRTFAEQFIVTLNWAFSMDWFNTVGR